MMGNPESSNTADKSASYNEETLSLQAVLSEADLSEDTRDKVQAKILAFEKYVSDETGYESLNFLHEVTAETEDRLSISVTSCRALSIVCQYSLLYCSSSLSMYE